MCLGRIYGCFHNFPRDFAVRKTLKARDLRPSKVKKRAVLNVCRFMFFFVGFIWHMYVKNTKRSQDRVLLGLSVKSGENNDKSRNSQVLTKILNYELIHKKKNHQQEQSTKIYVLGLKLGHASFFAKAHCTVSVQWS